MGATAARCKRAVRRLKEGVSQQLTCTGVHHPITGVAFCAHPDTSFSLPKGKSAPCSHAASGASQLQVVFLPQVTWTKKRGVLPFPLPIKHQFESVHLESVLMYPGASITLRITHPTPGCFPGRATVWSKLCAVAGSCCMFSVQTSSGGKTKLFF